MAKNDDTSSGNGTPEHLTSVMMNQGFEPARVYNAFFIEFSKTYSDNQGRLARAVVQFERPTAGPVGRGVRLSGFTALVQAHIEASEEAVAERAPQVMQSDLLAVLAAFQVEEQAPQSVAVERCTSCGTLVAEFFVRRGQVLCRTCKEEHADPKAE